MSEITKGCILQSNAENEREEIELKEKYNQIFILKIALEKANIPFEFFKKEALGYHICYPSSESCVCSVIEHIYSHGNDWDLLEIMGLLTDEEQEHDTVAGYLPAYDVYNRIREHWLKNRDKKTVTNYERIKNMSVEEMAEFINGVTSSVAVKLNCEYVSNDIKYIKQWLETEVEG